MNAKVQSHIYVVLAGSFGNIEHEFSRQRMVVAFRDPEQAKHYAVEANKLADKLDGTGAAQDLIKKHQHLTPGFLLNPLDPASTIGSSTFDQSDSYAVEAVPLLSAVPRRPIRGKRKAGILSSDNSLLRESAAANKGGSR